MPRSWSPLPVALLLVACAPPAPEPPPLDVAAVEQAVADLWTAYSSAVTSENVEAVVAYYAEDVVLDVKGLPPVMGRPALDSLVRMVWQGMDIQEFRMLPGYTNVVTSDLVHQGGAFTELFTRNDSTIAEYGRYATGLVRGADGQWRIAYLMGFPDSMVAR